MAKHTFEMIERKRKFFAQRILTLVLVFVAVFTLTYIVGLAAARHNARSLVEPVTTTQAGEEDEDSADADKAGSETAENGESDETGESGENAQSQTGETAEGSNGRTIYLTFDDGPGVYTERLLDILKKHDVKATFFLTHVYSQYESLIKREANEGHAVAVHSYTHDYDKIYASTDAYWEDFNAMQEVIKAQTGSETKMFRFPGGSSNTVSRKTNPGIMKTLVQQANEKGLSYFDWNVASGDAANNITGAQVLQNCKVGVANFKNAVVLCHDVKEYTVNVMDEFITWALSKGYTFAVLTPESDGAHHQVNN